MGVASSDSVTGCLRPFRGVIRLIELHDPPYGPYRRSQHTSDGPKWAPQLTQCAPVCCEIGDAEVTEYASLAVRLSWFLRSITQSLPMYRMPNQPFLTEACAASV